MYLNYAIPEHGTWILLVMGIAMGAWLDRRRGPREPSP